MKHQIPMGFWAGWNIGNIIWFNLTIKSGSQCALELLITSIILILILKFSKQI